MTLLTLLRSGAAADPLGAVMTAPLDGAVTVTVRRAAAQGNAYSVRAGLGHAAPADPEEAGWTLVTETDPTAEEYVTDEVPLPGNDDDYSVAVFGADGAGGYSSASVVVDAFGVAAPSGVLQGSGFAAALISTDRAGWPYLEVSEDDPGFAGATAYDGRDDPSPWRLLDPSEVGAIGDSDTGTALDPSGWPAASSGRLVRCALPSPPAGSTRYVRFAHRVSPT